MELIPGIWSRMPSRLETEQETGRDTFFSNCIELSKDIGAVTPGSALLLYGHPVVYRASLFMIEELLKRTDHVALIDGANRFDVYTLARLAEMEGINPSKILDRVYLSRVFTGYQMDAVLTNGIVPFLNLIHSRVVFVFGLLHTLFDDQMPARESYKSLLRIRSQFEIMKKGGISIVFASENIYPHQSDRVNLTGSMLNMADKAYLFNESSMHSINRKDLFALYRKRAVIRR
ncbi:MAG: hypothetical protein M1378_11580 [Bacteroidetes bacterium]|nr:hypothetical protein [Bacteroidota bacterium]